ncbi:tyrosine-type recombinase/integrase [Polynucleobacter sp. MWH-Mekk-B1]|uniref:phage integrase n=1 Tax=Polynucleobacter finlandensis TaxID=1855894 RepID=UPI001C0BB3AB|nr:tyrosine-type recombinase/integrase [Polynucleobacter finlandensis]MBU3545483.1 tyrosine-type recombinase/integrase [Polynucleobacter finlandensis]
MIKKTESGWQVDIQPDGRGGKRFRKIFTNLAEAKNWEAFTRNSVIKNKGWTPEKRDIRKLSEIVKIWYDAHGKILSNAKDTYARLTNMVAALKDPIADQLTPQMFTKYRSERIEGGLSLNSFNREHSYLRAVFNELIRLNLWKKANPVSAIRQFKIADKELGYLEVNELRELLSELQSAERNSDVYLIGKICLSTGSRWSEGENLRPSNIKKGVIEFINTKNKKMRAIPISSELQEEIQSHEVKENGRYFGSSMGAFKSGIERAGIVLPDGQLTHVLRHTFASSFMQGGGNILTLQKILGHQSLQMTMRYAHLAPTHLEAVKLLNPLVNL